MKLPATRAAAQRTGGRGRRSALLLALASLLAAPAVAEDRVRELHYGEVLYHHYQQDYFTALTRLLVAHEQRHIEPGREDTELLRIGIELSYGLHENALAAFSAMLEGKVAPQARDAIWLSLARTWVRRGYPERAEHALSQIGPRVSAEASAERAVLRARLLLERGDDAAAAALLAGVRAPPVWAAYAHYNRLMATSRTDGGDAAAGLQAPGGDAAPDDRELGTLRDYTSTALGYIHLAAGRLEQASAAFDRVGAGSAAAGEALLGAAAAAFERGDTARAIRTWDELGGRDAPGAASYEARLMAAHARWRLGERHEASERYRAAVALLDREIAGLDAAIAGIRDDASFARLVEASVDDARDGPRGLAAVYGLPQLSALVSGDDFNEAWNAYRSLRFLKRHLETWAADMAAFEAMLATRRQAYAQRLPQARDRLAAIGIEALEAKAAAFRARVDEIDRNDDAFALANAGERRLAALIARVEARLAAHPGAPDLESARDRLRVLKGVLTWNVERDYKARLWDARREVAALDAALERVAEGQARLLQAQEEAPGRFEGFDARIADLRTRIAALRERLSDATGRHERYLQTLTVAELDRQRDRARAYGARARYELAGLLDEIASEAADGDRRPALAAWLEFSTVASDDERRMHAMRRIADLQLMLGEETTPDRGDRQAGIQAAIESYQELLRAYPDYPDVDGVLYQIARAHDGLGETEDSLEVLTRLVDAHPGSPRYAEAQFRRGEMLFVQRDYTGAERAYRAVLAGAGASPFHQQALYKHGWSLFKQGRYEEGLNDFMAVLDHGLTAGGAAESAPPDLELLPRAERELAADTLRVIGLSFSYLDGPRSVSAYLASRAPVPYEHLVFTSLADLYLEKERYSDAASTFAGYVARNPDHEYAPAYQIRVFEIYERAGFAAPALAARQDFLRDYGPRSPYWSRHDIARMPQVADRLRQELLAMAHRSHAEAQATRAAADYRSAAQWYRDYLAFFPGDGESPRLSFMLAELLSEAGDHAEAIERYEQSAYDYPPHPHAAEAGYAALLSYERRIAALSEGEEKAVWQEHAVVSALRFAARFPEHPETPAVLTRTAERLFAQGQHEDATLVAARLLQREPPADPRFRRTAWTIVGHVQFDRADYGEAETAYAEAIALTPAEDADRAALVERQAAAIYQQGYSILASDAAGAADHFLRVALAAPSAAIVETAEYDAAAALMSIGAWERAIPVLERFRGAWPASRWQGEVTRKLSVALLESGQLARAAEEFGRLGREGGDPETAREALWQSADLYMQAGRTEQSLQAYQRYIAQHPQPLDQAVEARRRIAETYHAQGNAERRLHWLNEIVAADARAGAARTDFSRETAAAAALALAEPLRARYEGIRLLVPLDRSLKAKQAAMEQVLKAYRRAADYGVAEVTTAATFQVGEVYHELSRALLGSQRPAGLSEEEREQYDILLEEQAYPFEEEAIKLHEVNYRRIAEGLYDEWVKRSMEQLATLLPARYGKTEILVSAIESIH